MEKEEEVSHALLPDQEGKNNTCRNPDRSSLLTSHNDSGYSSELTSPEYLREEGSSGSSTHGKVQTTATKEKELSNISTPTSTKINTRLTSTPHTRSTQNAFKLPHPKIETIDKVVVGRRRNRYNSTTDSPITNTTTTTTTATEMKEMEVTCGETNRRPQRTQNKQQTPRKGTVTKFKAVLRNRKPVSVFVRLLKDADYMLHRVLRYLDGEELVRVSHVNQQLRDLILKDKVLGERRMRYLQGRKTKCERVGKENFKLKRLNEGNNRGGEGNTSYPTLSPRKHLSDIQNLRVTTTLSPEKVIPLSQRFIQEGQKLSNGDGLQKCVKCKSPAVVHKGEHTATCSSSIKCGYEYCINCHLPTHRRPQECPVLKPRTRQAAAAAASGIFSNRCKRNLRRL